MTSLCKLLFCAIAILSSAALAQPGKPDVCPSDGKDFTAIQQRAAANDPVAQMALASCYDLGLHVQPDGKESIRRLTEAANQDYAPAQYELGRIYLYGRGIPIDYVKALLWERKAADHGDPRAQRDLAFMYERGFGVPTDPVQAAEWNRKAAAQGHPEAQTHLARALDEGTGVSKNPDEARQWYGKAAEQEQSTAQLELARKFAQVPDCAEAAQWYKKAAVHGQTAAMYELGKLHLKTRCGADRNQAFVWFTIGARFGSKESQAEAERLAHALTSAQKKRAHLIAERWIQEYPGTEEDEEEKR
jgi:TPR repeat protein